MMFSRKVSLISNLSEYDEEKVIEEALVTPYEKCIKILQKVVAHLESAVSTLDLANEVTWVIQKINSRKLYSYEAINDQSMDLEKMSKNSHEVKSFLEYLSLYSENKDVKKRQKECKSMTTVVKEKINFIRQKSFGGGKELGTNTLAGDSLPGYSRSKQHMPSLFFQAKAATKEVDESLEKTELKFDDSSFDGDWSPIGRQRLSVDNSSSTYKSQVSMSVKDEFDTGEPKRLPGMELQAEGKIVLKDYIEISTLFDMSFNIFEFRDSVGNDNVLITGASELINNLDLNQFISNENLFNFLIAVRNGYRTEPPYHTALHGIDVMQTVCIYLSNTNVCELLALNDLDVLAFTLAALVHDLGHPGYNNGFQINFQTEMAVNYNDKSVLENYHLTSTFKILKQDDCNIFKKLGNPEFRNVRRRMIESILSTDMLFHSKIMALMKNRLFINGIVKGANQEKVIDKSSQNIFDEQQEVLNFLLHTADISHNSKAFNISKRWTDLLMEEFWRQGDYEKLHSLPPSFLCDRETADVPKSQIGFIKGIIIPTFDILADLLPDLAYYQSNVRVNLEEWGKIIEEREKQKQEAGVITLKY